MAFDKRPATDSLSLRETLFASDTLRRAFSLATKRRADLTEVVVRVGGSGTGENNDNPDGTAVPLIITIRAETQAHAEEHGMELQDQGCSCQSTGETEVTCDCTGVS